MAQYYLWAYPDNAQQWIGVGWIAGEWQKTENSTGPGYTNITHYVKKNFPMDDTGWWWATPGPMETVPPQYGRYEKSYWDQKMASMDRIVTKGEVGV